MTQREFDEQPNSQAGFQPPFKYTGSLTSEQIAELGATVSKGHQLLRDVSQMLVDFGQELLERQGELGKDFKKWLAHYFPERMAEVRQAMAIAGLVNRQPQYKEQMMGWSRSALAALSRLDDERVVEVLASGVKWTVKAIQELKRSLKAAPTEDPQAVATEEDWQRLAWDGHELEESDKNSLRECARNLACEEAGEGETEIEVKVGHIKAAVELHKERLLPVLSHRRIGKSGAAPISMKDYNDLMNTLQRQRKLMRDLKEKNQKLIEEQSSLYQQALVQARQEVAEFWERQKALLAHLRRADSERKQLAVEKQALEAEVAALKASAGTGLDGDAGADSKVEADPQEVEEVAACFETVFGEQAVRKLHVSEVLSSLEKPVLETLQLLVEGLRRHAKFLTPFSRSTVSQKTPHAGTEFDQDFAFEVNQIPAEWEPL